jgi:2-oxoisovalerate dehydrogenase E1 component subunit alpha
MIAMTKQAIKFVNQIDMQASAMPQQKPSTVAHFDIHYYQTLDAEGHLVGPLPKFAQNSAQLIKLYQCMYKTRLFDSKAISLQRRGQLGTYASSLGQEAIGAAIGTAMAKDDVLLPTYREYAAQFSRGVSMTEILMYWGGSETGMDYQVPRKDFPICVPIASQAPQAVGVAYAMQLRAEKRAAVCVLGDGATSKGDFYEAINAAGVWNLPVIFIVCNNRWAISLPRETQTHAATLAQKAIAAGLPGEQVDGNDVLALYARIKQALHKARSGAGPTLIEALTYRLSDHTTADDASRYRSEQELQENWKFEPINRLRQYLTDAGFWSEQDEKQLHKDSNTEVENAVKQYLSAPPQPPESMFDYLYESLPANLQEQRQAVIRKE